MSAKILHFADVHLGMTNFGHLDSETGLSSRILEFLDALDCVADAAEVYRPDLILFAGDAFRTRMPNPSLVSHFSERIQRMADVAPVICVVGNHDRQRGGSGKRHSISILSELHANFEIRVCDTVERLCTDKICVVTLPWFYADESSLEEICSDLDEALEKVPEDLPVVLLGHCEVEGAVYNDLYAAKFSLGGKSIVYPLSIFEEGWDYVALGHVHKHQCLCKDPPVVYAGAIERIDWGERNEPKGFITADVSPGKAIWAFHNSYAREMVQIDLPYDKHFQQMLRDRPVDDCLVRVSVTTKKHVGRDKILSEINQALQGSYFLDRVDISDLSQEERRPFEGQRIESKSMFELLEMYLQEKYPDNDSWVDTCLDVAHKMIEGDER